MSPLLLCEIDNPVELVTVVVVSLWPSKPGLFWENFQCFVTVRLLKIGQSSTLHSVVVSWKLLGIVNHDDRVHFGPSWVSLSGILNTVIRPLKSSCTLYNLIVPHFLFLLSVMSAQSMSAGRATCFYKSVSALFVVVPNLIHNLLICLHACPPFAKSVLHTL